MQQVTTKNVLGYALLPRILPRVRGILSMAFSHTAFFVALIFEAVRLLPSTHPYLHPQHFGNFTVFQVVKQAYKHLRFDFKHIDQIIMFSVVVLGIIIFFAQIIILAFSVMFPFAMAYYTLNAPVQFDVLTTFTLSTIIETQFPEDDIAFMLMDRVFGVDDMFNSRYDPAGIGVGGFPYPYHLGLHTLFQTFSVAMLTVGLIILTYFVITILAETARDGTPFGRRFNRVWAPIRLVMAFGLLVPMTNGLNAAQYIVLVSAKWGSSFATNGLQFYYGDIHASGQTPFGPLDTLIATPNPPDPANMLQFMLTARACQYATQFYQTYDNVGTAGLVTSDIEGYYLNYLSLADEPRADVPLFDFGQTDSAPFAVFNAGAAEIGNMAAMFQQAAYQNIILTFGERNLNKYPDKAAGLRKFCGSISIPHAASQENLMAMQILGSYMAVLSLMWQDQEIVDAAGTFAQSKMNNTNACSLADYPATSCPPTFTQNMSDFKARKTLEYRNLMRDLITEAITDNTGTLDWCGPATDPYLLSYGWGGAAICYNRIAQYNGAFTSAVMSFPKTVLEWPESFHFVQQARQKQQQSISVDDRFNPYLTGNNDELDLFEGDTFLRVPAEATYEAYSQWQSGGTGTGDGLTPDQSGGGVKAVINFLFGTEGVFSMTRADNRDIHPLAQLASAGRGLVQSAINNIGIAATGVGIGMVTNITMLSNISSTFLMTFAIITLSAGFVLHYLIPLMPFLYFFFAISSWIKTIFEAMVGVPLWALAHIRIDGDGIPGNAAMAGYFLILEIFLRPIMILFGLLASSLIFSAMAKVLNELWSLVVDNVTGYDQVEAAAGGFNPLDIESWRAPVDEFFYTIIYVIIVYMLALASFKLVDLIPNYIMRWLGQSVETFAETAGDSADTLKSKATVGVAGGSREVLGGAGNLAQGISDGTAANRGVGRQAAAMENTTNR